MFKFLLNAVLFLGLVIGVGSIVSVGLTSLFDSLLSLIVSLVLFGVFILVAGSYILIMVSAIFSFFESPKSKLLKKEKLAEEEKKKLYKLAEEENKKFEMKAKEEKIKSDKMAQGLYLQSYSKE